MTDTFRVEVEYAFNDIYITFRHVDDIPEFAANLEMENVLSVRYIRVN